MEQEYKYMVCTSCMTYNHAPYIVDAMNGFVMQETTFPVYYLITDDASTDGEPEVIRQYLLKHFQEPYRTEKTDDYNLICATHNTNPNCIFIVFLLKYNHYSIKKSKLPYQSEWRDNAKYLALCEGDDYWTDSNKLQLQIDYMEFNPQCVISHTAFNYLNDNNSKVTDSEEITKKNLSLLTSGNDLRAYILDSNRYLIQTMTVVILSEAYKKALKILEEFKGLFLMGDTQLWITLLELGSIYFFENKTATYRLHYGSATHQKSIDRILRFQLSCSEMRVVMAERFNLSVEWKNHFYEQYNRMLTKYLWFDNSYIPFIQPRYHSFWEHSYHFLLRNRIISPIAKRVYLANLGNKKKS